MSAEDSSPADRTDEQSYRDIIVPSDGSDGSQLALEHAIAIAKAFDGHIHALSVDEGSGSAKRDQMRTDSEELADEAASNAAERAEARGVPASVVVRSGSVEQTIHDYAEEADIDIIVMGTHGRSGIKGAIFGSVAEEFVRNSPVPVLTVRHEDDSE